MAKQAQVKPMPFPGESPTVALAMAAGEKYGMHEEEAKPAKRKAAPKRKATASRKASATARKASPKRKATGAKKKAAR